MADTVVLRGNLPAVLSNTVDLTSSGFGTPTAALIFMDSTGPTVDPNTSSASLSVGMYDGTDQRVVSVYSQDAQDTTNVTRYINSGEVGLLMNASGSVAVACTASFIDGGIRLTVSQDNTSIERYVTVVLFKGVSAKVLTFTPNSSDTGTAESASIGFAPKAMAVIGNGGTLSATVGSHSIISLGFASESDGNKACLFASRDNVGTSVVNSRMETDACAGQVYNDTLGWTASVTTWGSDTFTMTSSGAPGGDQLCCLVFDDSLTCQLGNIDARSTTGDQVISTTGFDPESVIVSMTNRSAQDSTGTGGTSNEYIGIGAADANGGFAHGHIEGDGLGNINVKSHSSATDFIEVHSASAGTTYTDECNASLSALGTEQFTINYNRAVGSTVRRGWYVAFGAATVGDPTATAALASGGATLSATATYDSGTFTATASLDAAGATGSATASFTPSLATYTATADVTAAGAELSASGTFVGPTYTATANLNASSAIVVASGTHVAPSFTATADVFGAGAEVAAVAVFASAVFSASAPLNGPASTIDASASYVAPNRTATATLQAPGAEVVASGVTSEPTYTATASLVGGAATASATGTFVAPTYTATANLTSAGAVFTATAVQGLVPAVFITLDSATIAISSADGSIEVATATGSILV